MKRIHKRRRTGLTLLELMIVLVILVGLIALVGPRLLGTQAKADVKNTKTQIGNLESALKLYAVDMRTFPNSEDGLKALLQSPTDEKKARKWEGPYLDDEIIPGDAWDNEFIYEYPPAKGKRDFPNVASPGPDGELNTEDDIINWRSDEGDSEGDGQIEAEGTLE
ncbi:MAG: type II secretion system major pseudopilin GspG [Pirellulaceae bacterium]|nr:type II secretion system major pseudopilin GspG [Pirellulaceae bacterium]